MSARADGNPWEPPNRCAFRVNLERWWRLAAPGGVRPVSWGDAGPLVTVVVRWNLLVRGPNVAPRITSVDHEDRQAPMLWAQPARTTLLEVEHKGRSGTAVTIRRSPIQEVAPASLCGSRVPTMTCTAAAPTSNTRRDGTLAGRNGTRLGWRSSRGTV